MNRLGPLVLIPVAVFLLASCSTLPPIRPGEGLSLERTRRECGFRFSGRRRG
jgi:hypothetical protein